MSLDQSFYNFCTDIVTSNNLLAGGDLYMDEKRIKEQIFNNMTEDLREKLEESATELAALNALTFQKWLNAISETDIKMAKAVKRSAKRVAMELEKEEKKKRHLTSPSVAASRNTNTNTATDAQCPYQKYNRSRNTLLPLTNEERALIYEHRGCFKCRKLYVNHIQRDCPDGFPDVHVPITLAMATSAKAEADKTRRLRQGVSYNRGPAASTSTSTVAAVIEDSSDVSGNEGDEDEEEKSGIVAMTWPSAIALSDSDSDKNDVSPPLTIPNLYWHANAVGCDGFLLKLKR
jgi:hypothetical protein